MSWARCHSLDYTAVHIWWNNDDLLWDGVMTKVPEKPNLHQETGLMRIEDADGNPWRTPESAARLLERKLAYAFASRGAGVVQWAWNINPYQPIDNESVIGLFRPDGTAKPELRALRDLAAFFRQAAPWLDDFEPDPVVMVVPHARLFSGRSGDLEATRRVVRVLAERYGVVPTARAHEPGRDLRPEGLLEKQVASSAGTGSDGLSKNRDQLSVAAVVGNGDRAAHACHPCDRGGVDRQSALAGQAEALTSRQCPVPRPEVGGAVDRMGAGILEEQDRDLGGRVVETGYDAGRVVGPQPVEVLGSAARSRA